jgi:predicted nuclease of restriction endonuclease-like RecB superfamily
VILPSELVRVRRRKGQITPLYAGEDTLSLCRTLVSVFESNIGKRRGELKEALDHCEDMGYNYKLVRGLSAVLEDRSVFRAQAAVNPSEVRMTVFDAAGGSVIATDGMRTKIMVKVASRLSVSVDDLENSLYADLWDEHVLSEFEASEPMALLKEYNFALTSTILTQARRIELNYEGSDRVLEDLANALGICKNQMREDLSILTIETRPSNRGKHADMIERLLATLLSHDGWRLKADVVQPSSGKAYTLTLSKEKDGRIMASRDRKKLEAKQREVEGEHFEDVMLIEELAAHLGVTESEARRRMQAEGRYVDIGGVMVTKGKLEEIRGALANTSDMSLPNIVETFKKLGCRRPLQVLEALGYSVDWAADRDQSKVHKIGKR